MILNLKIVTPERTIFEGKVQQVTLPTEMGEITVLPHHLPLVANLVTGDITIKLTEGFVDIATTGGFVEVSPNAVTILADAADRGDELDEQEVAEAVRRAEKAITETGMADRDYAALRASLDREVAKLRVARRYKQRGIRTSADQ